MESPSATNGKSAHNSPATAKSNVDSPTRRSHKSRSRSRDRHSSSRSHREHRDRDKDRDRDRRRTERDREDRHRSRRSSRSPEDRTDRNRDRDRDRERRHKDDRDYRDRDRERDRDRRDKDGERDKDRRRRKLDDTEDPSPRPDERSSKRPRPDDDAAATIPGSPMVVDGAELNGNGNGKAPSVRDRSMDSDRRSSTRRSDDGRRRLPVDDRSPPPRRRSPPPRRYGGPDDRPYGRRRSPPPRRRRPSPSYENQGPGGNEDSEARSVFVTRLAARMTNKDLGYFFEEHLGEGSVIDPRIVTDRLSRRSKGIAYVELASVELVQKALELNGTNVMGQSIGVQLAEAERNKQPATSDPAAGKQGGGSMQLYVGSLHFNLTEVDIRQVFEPFGELELVDLHKDPVTGRSRGYAFVQFKRAEDAKMALEQMEGFELAGRQLRVNTVHEKGTGTQRMNMGMGGMGGAGQVVDSLDENGGSLNNNSSRHILMQKLARTEAPVARPTNIMRPNIPEAKTRNVALKNMFDPAEETEQDWDTDLAEDVKGECSEKYGPVTGIKVIKESQGEIYVQFDTVDSAAKALTGLNGRWFGGKLVSASFVSDVIMQAYL